MVDSRVKWGIVLAAFMALIGHAHAESVLHQPTGITLPDEIAGFERVRVHDHESRKPGLGFSYHYMTKTGAVASIYIYTAGLLNVPSDVNDPLVVQLRERTIRELFLFAQMNREAPCQTLKDTLEVKTNKAEVLVLFDGFIISSPSGERSTLLWLWSSRSHFFKIRLTHLLSEELDPKQLRDFYESMVRLSAE
jgi:hypothetical protein